MPLGFPRFVKNNMYFEPEYRDDSTESINENIKESMEKPTVVGCPKCSGRMDRRNNFIVCLNCNHEILAIGSTVEELILSGELKEYDK